MFGLFWLYLVFFDSQVPENPTRRFLKTRAFVPDNPNQVPENPTIEFLKTRS